MLLCLWDAFIWRFVRTAAIWDCSRWILGARVQVWGAGWLPLPKTISAPVVATRSICGSLVNGRRCHRFTAALVTSKSALPRFLRLCKQKYRATTLSCLNHSPDEALQFFPFVEWATCGGGPKYR